MKIKNNIWKIVIIIAILIIGGAVLYSNHIANIANEGVTFEPHIKGNPDALVKLVEYSDFQCPACAQFYYVVSEIMDTHYGALQLEHKHFPLILINPLAIPSAKAAEAAGQQGKFFEMRSMLLQNQQDWSRAINAQAYFNTYAEEIGLDVDLFQRHMRSSLITDKIKDELDEALALGLNSTPTFFLNGEQMQFQTFEEFIDQIEEAVEYAQNTPDSVE